MAWRFGLLQGGEKEMERRKRRKEGDLFFFPLSGVQGLRGGRVTADRCICEGGGKGEGERGDVIRG